MTARAEDRRQRTDDGKGGKDETAEKLRPEIRPSGVSLSSSKIVDTFKLCIFLTCDSSKPNRDRNRQNFIIIPNKKFRHSGEFLEGKFNDGGKFAEFRC